MNLSAILSCSFLVIANAAAELIQFDTTKSESTHVRLDSGFGVELSGELIHAKEGAKNTALFFTGTVRNISQSNLHYIAFFVFKDSTNRPLAALSLVPDPGFPLYIRATNKILHRTTIPTDIAKQIRTVEFIAYPLEKPAEDITRRYRRDDE
jgi:hypothetical protein